MADDVSGHDVHTPSFVIRIEQAHQSVPELGECPLAARRVAWISNRNAKETRRLWPVRYPRAALGGAGFCSRGEPPAHPRPKQQPYYHWLARYPAEQTVLSHNDRRPIARLGSRS